MKYSYKRKRSDFWITVYEENGEYSISTGSKYVDIINYCWYQLEMYSPTKWKKSKKLDDVYNLWIPEGRYDPDIVDDFLQWCDDVTQNVLWLGLNKNIQQYFSDELEYCIACDFNFDIDDEMDRTEIGEAEYQLKYKADKISEEDQKKYADIIINRVLYCRQFIPVRNKSSWYISPMPATEAGKRKMAWYLAEAVSRQTEITFLAPTLTCDKPQMKNLSIKEKIETWEEIYYNDGVALDKEVSGKDVIVIDDLYQSGTTMWQYAKFLKESGARSVFGVVCVKSLKDSDNT